MDPKAAIQYAKDLLADFDLDNAEYAIDRFFNWRDKGGFASKLMSEEADALWSEINFKKRMLAIEIKRADGYLVELFKLPWRSERWLDRMTRQNTYHESFQRLAESLAIPPQHGGDKLVYNVGRFSPDFKNLRPFQRWVKVLRSVGIEVWGDE